MIAVVGECCACLALPDATLTSTTLDIIEEYWTRARAEHTASLCSCICEKVGARRVAGCGGESYETRKRFERDNACYENLSPALRTFGRVVH